MEQGAFVGGLVSKGEHCPAVPACSVWGNLCPRALVREGVVCLTFKLWTNTKYKYNSYFYCAPYSLTDGALQKSANTCFTALGRLK